MPLSPEDPDLAAIRTLLGQPDLAPDVAVSTLVKNYRSDIAEAAEQVALSRTAELRAELETARGELTAANEKVALSRGATTTSPDVLHDRAGVRMDRIKLLFDRNDITPAWAEKLRGMVRAAGADDGEPRAVYLSRTADGGKPPIDEILDMFDGAKMSPASGVALSRASVAPLPGEGQSQEGSAAAAYLASTYGRSYPDKASA